MRAPPQTTKTAGNPNSALGARFRRVPRRFTFHRSALYDLRRHTKIVSRGNGAAMEGRLLTRQADRSEPPGRVQVDRRLLEHPCTWRQLGLGARPSSDSAGLRKSRSRSATASGRVMRGERGSPPRACRLRALQPLSREAHGACSRAGSQGASRRASTTHSRRVPRRNYRERRGPRTAPRWRDHRPPGQRSVRARDGAIEIAERARGARPKRISRCTSNAYGALRPELSSRSLSCATSARRTCRRRGGPRPGRRQRGRPDPMTGARLSSSWSSRKGAD